MSVTIDNGLPNNRTTGTTKDTRGFVWFATDDGICRYDGISTRNYNTYFGHQTEEFDQRFTSIYTTRSGKLLAGSFHLFLFNYETDQLEFVFEESALNQPERIHAIIEDENNTIWLGARNGIFRMDSNFQTTQMPPDINGNHYHIRDLIKVEDEIWIGTRHNGVLVYNLHDSSYTKIPLYNEFHEMAKIVLSLFHDEDIIWVGTKNNGLYKINRKTHAVISHEFPDKDVRRIRDIAKDKNNNLWLGTLEGLYFISKESDEYYRYAFRNHPVSSITNNSVFDVFIDNTEIMWLSTLAGGINFTDLNNKMFHLIRSKENNNNFLNNAIVSGFCVDKDNNVYVGTDHGGLNFWNRKTNTFTYYLHGLGSVSGTNIKCMVSDSKGNIWIGTDAGGISCFTPDNKKFKYYFSNPDNANSLQSNTVYSLAIDKEENIWIGTELGVDLLNTESGKIDHKYSSDNIHIVYIDQKGSIWMAIDGIGLFHFNEHNNTFEIFADSLHITSPRTLLRDSNNNLWIGKKKGISVLNLQSRKIYHYDKQKGLSSNIILGFLEDQSQNIWVSSSSGLMQLIGAASDPGSFYIRTYTIEDGLQSNQFWRNSAYKSEQGEMFFGGVNGFNCFYPEHINENNYKPEIAFSDLKILNNSVLINQVLNGQVVLDKSINETDELVLNHKQKIFTLDFVTLHYSNSKKNKYKYMLFPFEQDWNYSEYPRNSATYTSLPAGKYIFNLQGANSDGVWQTDVRQLLIRIKPPVWKTWWFISMLVVCLAIGLIYLFYQRLNRIKKQKIQLEQLVEQRTKDIEKKSAKLKELNSLKDKLFSIIAHDLRNPFQAILGFSNLLKLSYNNFDDNKRQEYINMISESADRYNNLLENLLSWSRSQSGRVPYQPKALTISSLVDQVIDLLDHKTERKEIVITNEISRSVKVFADEQMIFSVLNNLISNAIKFTESNGEVRLGLKKQEEMVVVSVTDNGVGLSREETDSLFSVTKTNTKEGTSGEKGTGLGLLICKDFVEKNKGEIWADSIQGEGTTFYFSLPLALNKSGKASIKLVTNNPK